MLLITKLPVGGSKSLNEAQSHFYPLALPLPLRFVRSREGVGVSRFSFGWRGRGKRKGQIALQTKIFRDHTTNEGVYLRTCYSKKCLKKTFAKPHIV